MKRGLSHLCINEVTGKIYCANSHYKDIEVLNEDGYSEFLNIPLQRGNYEIALNSTTYKLYVAIKRLLRRSMLNEYNLDDSALEHQTENPCRYSLVK